MGLGSQRLMQGSFAYIITAVWTLGFLSVTSDAVSKKYLMTAGPYLQKDSGNRFSSVLHVWLKIAQN